jgi:hypothetical protein
LNLRFHCELQGKKKEAEIKLSILPKKKYISPSPSDSILSTEESELLGVESAWLVKE